ncbi:MAG: branched-chain amino acid ABC transporter permease [Candidatus Dormibacteraceae bacterium]
MSPGAPAPLPRPAPAGVPEGLAAGPPWPVTQTLGRHLLLAAGAAVLLLLLSYAVDAYADYNLAGIAIFAIAAAGLNLVTGVNGQLSLGHGALMAIGAYTTSVLLKHDVTLALPAVVLAAVASTSAAGAIFGVAAARLRGPYLAGATLALAVALPQVAIRFSGVFGGEEGLTVPPAAVPAFLGTDFPQERWMAWIALAAALLTLVLVANLLRGGVGRALRAVRDDEAAAALAGIDVARTQVLAFVVSSACAGLAGSLFALWVGLTAPAGFGLSLSLQLLSAIVIGGLGSLAGAVWGSIVLVALPALTGNLASGYNLSSDIGNNLPLAIYGAFLVAAMLLFPRGIQGGVARLFGIARTARREARGGDRNE